MKQAGFLSYPVFAVVLFVLVVVVVVVVVVDDVHVDVDAVVSAIMRFRCCCSSSMSVFCFPVVLGRTQIFECASSPAKL